MTDFSIKHDTDLHLNKVQIIDLTAFHRHDSLTQTDKKENKIYPRFAFLKNSCNLANTFLLIHSCKIIN